MSSLHPSQELPNFLRPSLVTMRSLHSSLDLWSFHILRLEPRNLLHITLEPASSHRRSLELSSSHHLSLELPSFLRHILEPPGSSISVWS